MAVLTNPGRAAVAKSVYELDIHLAWGSGLESWDTTPVGPDINASSLINEVGRRVVSQKMYCTPDPSGGLVVPTGTFSPSSTPTKYIYMRFAFDFADSPSAVIRELAVMLRTVPKPSVPSGKAYLLPAEVLSFGDILVLERIPKLERSASIRQQFEFVVEF